MSTVSWALTSLESAKLYLGNTSDDDNFLIEMLIGQASSYIEKECNRKLRSRAYSPYEDFEDAVISGDGTRKILLRQYPITNVERVDLDDTCIQFSALADSGAADKSTLIDASLAIFADNKFDGGYVDVIAGVSAGDKDKQVSSFDGDTGTCIMMSGHYFTSQVTATTRYVLYTGVRVWLRHPAGTLFYRDTFTDDDDNVEVWYTAGYKTDSAEYHDLSMLCLALVSGVYKHRDKIGFKSEDIGNYAYEAGADTLTEPWMKATIKRYKRKDYV